MPTLHASRYRRGVHEPRSKLAAARLYLCTDARRERGDLAEFADGALSGGVDIIQLRDKGSPGEQRFGPLEARGAGRVVGAGAPQWSARGVLGGRWNAGPAQRGLAG